MEENKDTLSLLRDLEQQKKQLKEKLKNDKLAMKESRKLERAGFKKSLADKDSYVKAILKEIYAYNRLSKCNRNAYDIFGKIELLMPGKKAQE